MTNQWLALVCGPRLGQVSSLVLIGGLMLESPGLGFRPVLAQAMPTVANQSAPKTILRPGDRGPEVSQLQLALGALGLYSAAADGIYGVDTAQAVRSLQRQQGLTVDGITGGQTWQALANAQRRLTLRLPPPILSAQLVSFTPLTVAQPAPPPSAIWLALMPLVPISGGALTWFQRRLRRQRKLRRRLAQRRLPR
ncbi:peptidoglycan-binding protein [Nodosilinea sp. LEGE 07088]|uniref:peptidoglycan-binding domain-containing protein n=1 Tax=Nodosilinea sp. LEGE 07088 TaxID=2777968 RepID=UPI0018809A0D|nr:peptidoglycan-binding protein [Nodosilinea sp. LEGE 07088]MBE9139030.1 peptidoglycan-binding protein [Nodosilinea sp. LEGE 07088]